MKKKSREFVEQCIRDGYVRPYCKFSSAEIKGILKKCCRPWNKKNVEKFVKNNQHLWPYGVSNEGLWWFSKTQVKKLRGMLNVYNKELKKVMIDSAEAMLEYNLEGIE